MFQEFRFDLPSRLCVECQSTSAWRETETDSPAAVFSSGEPRDRSPAVTVLQENLLSWSDAPGFLPWPVSHSETGFCPLLSPRPCPLCQRTSGRTTLLLENCPSCCPARLFPLVSVSSHPQECIFYRACSSMCLSTCAVSSIKLKYVSDFSGLLFLKPSSEMVHFGVCPSEGDFKSGNDLKRGRGALL